MISWYDKAQSNPNITQESGIKENILSGLVGALMMMLGGMGAEKAASMFNVDKESVEMAAKNPSMVEKAREVKQKSGGNWNSEEINKLISDLNSETEKMRQERANKSLQKQPAKTQPSKGHKSTSVGKALVDVIISLEHDPRKDVSSQGATGLMQIMRPTWEELNKKFFGGKYPYSRYAKNDSINQMFGEKYLNQIKGFLDQHKSKWRTDQASLIFACYHGGIGNIMECNFDPKIIQKKMPRTYDYMVRGSNLLGDKS